MVLIIEDKTIRQLTTNSGKLNLFLRKSFLDSIEAKIKDKKIKKDAIEGAASNKKIPTLNNKKALFRFRNLICIFLNFRCLNEILIYTYLRY